MCLIIMCTWQSTCSSTCSRAKVATRVPRALHSVSRETHQGGEGAQNEHCQELGANRAFHQHPGVAVPDPVEDERLQCRYHEYHHAAEDSQRSAVPEQIELHGHQLEALESSTPGLSVLHMIPTIYRLQRPCFDLLRTSRDLQARRRAVEESSNRISKAVEARPGKPTRKALPTSRLSVHDPLGAVIAARLRAQNTGSMHVCMERLTSKCLALIAASGHRTIEQHMLLAHAQ